MNRLPKIILSVVCIVINNGAFAHDSDSKGVHTHSLKDTSINAFLELQGHQVDGLDSLTVEELVSLCCTPFHSQPAAVEMLGVDALGVITKRLNSDFETHGSHKHLLVKLACEKYEEVGPMLSQEERNDLVYAIINEVSTYEGLGLRGVLTSLKAIKHPEVKNLAEQFIDSEDYWVRERAHSLLEVQNEILTDKVNNLSVFESSSKVSKPNGLKIENTSKERGGFPLFIMGIVIVCAIISFALKVKSKP